MLQALKRAETVSLPDDRLDAPAFVPQFFPQPTYVRIQRACTRLRFVTKDLLQKNRSGQNLPGVLHE